MGIEQLRAAAMLAAVVAPGLALFRHLGRGLRLTERFLLAFALAPLALALPALALALPLHVAVARCLWPAEFIWLVAALMPRPSRAGAEAEVPGLLPERGQGFPAIAAVATAVGAALLVAAVAFSGAFVLVSGDAWTHAAAVTEITVRGLPPQDPNFAGIPLYQPWLYHFILALFGVATRLSPFEQMALMNVWAVIVLVLGVAQLAYRAYGRAAAMWAGAIVMLGMDPFGWLTALVRAMGGKGGLAGAPALFGTGDAAAAALAFRFPASQVSLLSRFWEGSPLMPAVALSVAAAWSVARGLERPSRVAWVRSLLLALAAVGLEPLVAGIALLALAVGVIGAAARRGPRAADEATGETSGGASSGAVMAALLVALLALAAAAALWRATSPPGVWPAIALGLRPQHPWWLLGVIGPWWVIAAPALRPALKGSAAGRCGAVVAAASLVGVLVLVLPASASTALFALAWVSLAPLMAAGWVRWADRLRLAPGARATVLAILVVPTTALFTIGTAVDPRPPAEVIRGEIAAAKALPLATKDEQEGYRYLRDVLSDEVVVIESPRPTVNEPVPVLGTKRVFCGTLEPLLARRFGLGRSGPALTALRDECAVRQGIRDALFESGELDESQREYLSTFSAPLFLLLRRSEVPDPVWFGFMSRPGWLEDWSNHEMRLYRYVPQPLPAIPE